ncbi:MAG: BlaI/MecI/CopY family transcriptional regulator, partial [Planctomycetota bacterium]
HVRKQTQVVTDTEMAVLKLLWDRGPSTARAVTQVLYPKCRESDLGTVHSMLQRLEAKKLVARDRSSHAHVFTAAASRTEVAGKQLEAMADKLADGSMAPFLIHLVEAGRLTEEEVESIRNLLEDHSTKKGPAP